MRATKCSGSNDSLLAATPPTSVLRLCARCDRGPNHGHEHGAMSMAMSHSHDRMSMAMSTAMSTATNAERMAQRTATHDNAWRTAPRVDGDGEVGEGVGEDDRIEVVFILHIRYYIYPGAGLLVQCIQTALGTTTSSSTMRTYTPEAGLCKL